MANPVVAASDLAKALTKVLGWILIQVTVDPASLASGATATTNATVAGVTPQHRCIPFVNGALSAGGAVCSGAVCTTPGTVAVSYSNPSAGAIDLASHTLNLLCIPDFNS